MNDHRCCCDCHTAPTHVPQNDVRRACKRCAPSHQAHSLIAQMRDPRQQHTPRDEVTRHHEQRDPRRQRPQ